MINNKQGLSGIVVTLIIIGIALAAVGIVFYVINTVTKEQGDAAINASGDVNLVCAALTPIQTAMTETQTCTGVVSYHGGQKCCSVAPSGT